MAIAIFSLCLLVALACTALLGQAYRRSRERLLLWSGLCFLAFSFANALLIVDRFVLPETDLYPLRQAATFVGVCFMLYGMIWEIR